MSAARSILLHITTAAPWRMALDLGALVAPSLIGPQGFIHLSTPDQVHLPANALYAGRDDLLLLVIDPARIPHEIRWEPGEPSDPGSMRFPHLFGPLPTRAVTSVVPWRPGSDGFTPPTGLPRPDNPAARALAFDPSLAQRRAAAVGSFEGGFAVVDPRVSDSYEHNCVWMTGPRPAADIVRIADELLTGLGHRRVVLDTPPPDDLEWDVEEERIMVLDLSRDRVGVAESVEVTAVTTEVIGRLWRRQWHDSLPGVSEAAVDQLVDREQLAHAHVRVLDLAVLDGHGEPVASTQLRIDGATAGLEAVMTRPDHQGRGLARAVVSDAIDRAAAAGCDLLWLSADAADWPREWYRRLGFVEVGSRWVCGS